MRNGMFLVAAMLLVIGMQSADAQLVPRAVYYSAPTTYVQPVVAYRPVVQPTAIVVTPNAPAVYVAPHVVARPAVPVVAQPVIVPRRAVTTTRYRPILGGTVTRTWYP